MSDAPTPVERPSTSWDPEEPQVPVEDKVGILGELWQFVWENKMWWITPTLLILALLGFVIVSASGSAIAPFFYALF